MLTDETSTGETLSRQRRHFETLFSGDADPWGYRTRFSEQRRHSLVLSMLDRPTYASAFEPGCANGVLSTLLACRCTQLLASDASAAAVCLAREATSHLASITVEQFEVPAAWPTTTFDLIVLVDFLYYLEAADVAAVCTAATKSLSPDGTLVIAHWRGSADDFLTSSADVHRIARDIVGRRPRSALDDPDHLIDLWVGP